LNSLILKFTIITIFAAIFADIEIINLNPWMELSSIGTGLLNPDFSVFWIYKFAIINTFTFAICGITLSVILAIPLSLFFNIKIIRLFCSFIRSIHEIFWAFIILQLVGLNAVCGIISIAIPYAGIFAKVFHEIEEESIKIPKEVIPPNINRFSIFIYYSLPIIIKDISNYIKYRLECAIRSSAILGFIGLPTVGFYLETAFREGLYSEMASLLYIFFIIIALLKHIVKIKTIPILFIFSIYFISLEINFSLENFYRFFTYDILPWPIKKEGYYNNSYSIDFNIIIVIKWMLNIIKTEGLIGIWNTIILTQIGLFFTGIFAFISFPFATKKLTHPIIRRISHTILIIFRTTPEYILAYLFLLLWGPSMLPAIFAIFIHNGAILSFLTANNTNIIKIRFDNLNHKFNIFLYEITPKISGQFFAFLFYRWEVIMRESAILGILGIYSLGFYIDSAISDHQLDKAMFLILITAILNMIIDKISQIIRKKYRISKKLTVT
tara:strand:+ start:5883 stop:7370 length:1488 start_codon:yes stop_codon:yes gene_type:complete